MAGSTRRERARATIPADDVQCMIVSADRRFRDAMTSMLATSSGLAAQPTLPNVAAVRKLLRTSKQHIALIDLSLAHRDAGRIIRAVRSLSPQTVIVFLPPLAHFASSRAPSGTPRSLDRTIANALVAALRTLGPSEHDVDDVVRTLTLRQRHVAHFLAKGWTNHQVAKRCGMGIKTVKTHLTVIYRRFGVVRRAGLQAALRRSRLLARNTLTVPPPVLRLTVKERTNLRLSHLMRRLKRGGSHA
jgi:DNA-binding NarL/FixJ family response regulator